MICPCFIQDGCRFKSGMGFREPSLRIPAKPDAYSKMKPDTYSDFIPDSIPI